MYNEVLIYIYTHLGITLDALGRDLRSQEISRLNFFGKWWGIIPGLNGDWWLISIGGFIQI
jgi:hypothetical protein